MIINHYEYTCINYYYYYHYEECIERLTLIMRNKHSNELTTYIVFT